MQPKEIAESFNKEIFRLFGWDYSDAAVRSKGIHLRAAADKFIYQAISDSSNKSIDSRARSSNMPIPPPLETMMDIEQVLSRTEQVVAISKTCSTIDDLELALNIKPSTDEEKAGFDALLSLFLSDKR